MLCSGENGRVANPHSPTAQGQGSVYVEVQSAGGAPLPGYSLADALPVIDDGVALTVKWKAPAGRGLWSHSDAASYFLYGELATK